MAFHRVTMQDIADACGVSRNTVSKVFNGRGLVQEETRELILQKAQELGYAQLPALEAANKTDPNPQQFKTITVLAQSNPLNHSFGSLLIKAFTDQICRSGYTVQLYELSADELQNRQLPPHISMQTTAGILGIELFDKEYIDMICHLGIPTLFIDGYLDANRSIIHCDHISMENIAATITVVDHLIAAGARKLGFVGDPEHCNSFHERWDGFTAALKQADLPLDPRFCMLYPDGSPFWITDWVVDRLSEMEELPDAFVCANDYHAINIMKALKRMGIRIPEQVMVTGFDNSSESNFIDPNLTTVDLSAKEIGLMAADFLHKRILDPTRSYTFTYIQSKPIFRESTR